MTEEKAEYIKRMKIKQIHFAWDRYQDKDIIIPKFKAFKEITEWDKVMHEYIYKTTREISILRAKNKILEECLRERKEDENDECK